MSLPTNSSLQRPAMQMLSMMEREDEFTRHKKQLKKKHMKNEYFFSTLNLLEQPEEIEAC